MKKLSSIKLIVVLVAGLCLLSGCMPEPHKFEPLKGDENIVSRTIEVSDFSTIVMEMPVELHYVESDKPFLRITGDSNLIAAMDPRVEHHKLVLAVCWPKQATAAQDRFSMIPSQPLVVEAGSPKLEDFGWNVGSRGERYMMQDMKSGKTPSLCVLKVRMEDDSMAALTMMRLENDPLRLDVCYGTTDSILQHVEQLRQLRPVWETKWETSYSTGDEDVHIGNGWDDEAEAPFVTDTLIYEE